jgi:RHS repeat-associated protein
VSYCKSAVERYVWDGNQLLYEIRVPSDSGASSAALEADTSTVSAHYGRIAYVHGGGIDAPLALDRNGSVIIPHASYRGFYDAGTDSLGAAVMTGINWVGAERTPFMDNPPPTTLNGWGGSLIAGMQDQSGLMYRRNRYYDTGVGRFTQPDPIGSAGGPNAYSYPANDPINSHDPFGLNVLPVAIPFPIVAVGSGLVGGLVVAGGVIAGVLSSPGNRRSRGDRNRGYRTVHGEIRSESTTKRNGCCSY